MSVDSLIFFFLMLAIGYGVARLKLVPEQTADTLSRDGAAHLYKH